MECQQTDRLTVTDLHVEFYTSEGVVRALNGVSLEVQRGKITALVGESGSGKSVTSLAIMDLLPANGKVVKGDIRTGDIHFKDLSPKQRQKLNGTLMGMIFQDPLASLNPLYTVGNQMSEGLLCHYKINRKEAVEKSVSYLEAVDLQNPEQLMKKYPHELSGGMRQRVMIAIAMALHPTFLIADEPTTALDVTVQRQILSEIYQMSKKENVGVLFITHDLGVVAEIADYVYIMQDGEIVEDADVDTVFHHPKHYYTKQLLNAIL